HRPLKASLSGSANIAQAATGRPNVLLVTLDTVQAGHLSLYGYHRETSPHLRQLAHSATVYKNAIAASDMTLPSHASIFTGLYGREHGAHNLPLPDKTQPLDASFITLAEVLAGKSYVTAAVAANRFYLLPEFGMAQGFRLFDSKMPVMLFNNNRRYILREGVRRVLNLFLSTYDFDTRTLTAAEINQEVLPLLEQLKRETAPFFLFVNYMDAHLPYIPPPPFATLFPGKNRLLDFDAVTNVELDVIKQKRGIIPQERAHLESQYDGAIAYLDSEFANIIARLQQLGLYDNTMVVVVGDHGESFGDRGMMEHTVSVYQDQVHVPLIIHYPRQTQAETVDTTVSHVDLMPTILDVLGYPMPKPTQGRSLRGINGTAARQVISESYSSSLFATWVPKRFDRVERALYSGPIKFISSSVGKRELYDLSKDPAEQHNLFNPADPLTQTLRTGLENWVHNTRTLASRTKLDKRTMDRLRSLGYVQ